MYYLAIGFYLWQTNSWALHSPGISYSEIFSQIFFVHGFHPIWINSIVPGGWSVGLEMMFYALIPLLFHFIRNLNSAIVFFIVTIIFQYVINSLFIKYPLIDDAAIWGTYLYYYLPNQLPVFALGIILFQLVIKETNSLSIKPLLILTISFFILFQFYFDITIVPNFIFISIGFVLFALFLAKQEKNLFVNPLITYIGKVSYSAYLINFAVLELVIRFGITDILNNGSHYTLNYILRLVIVLSITLIISTVFYYLIEKPMQKAGGKIISLLENSHILHKKELSR
jgi:peptidoglycan/LPS O-acetylase OafA/YrhL